MQDWKKGPGFSHWLMLVITVYLIFEHVYLWGCGENEVFYHAFSLLTSFIYSWVGIHVPLCKNHNVYMINAYCLCKRRIALFSNAGFQHKWADRIIYVLEKRPTKTMQRATKDLVPFQDQATTNYVAI